ncbi:MAG: hypothetical protein ACI89L_002618, partial [Phycisphaerales bacterium]
SVSRGQSVPNPPDEQMQILAGATQHASIQIRTGFESAANVVQVVEEILGDEGYEGDVAATSRSLVQEEMDRLGSEQGGWEHPTDCERFDEAFDELNANGILARHHYSCCQNCGNTEIEIEHHHLVRQGLRPRGSTYYHVQDTESAVEGGGLYLAYGAPDGGEATRLIGEEVRETFERHGLTVRWDGTSEKRIAVLMDWKRPWPPRTPDAVPPEALEAYQARLKREGTWHGHGAPSGSGPPSASPPPRVERVTLGGRLRRLFWRS